MLMCVNCNHADSEFDSEKYRSNNYKWCDKNEKKKIRSKFYF